MGDKIEAKRTAAKLGLPLVPGSPGPLTSVAQAKKLAGEHAQITGKKYSKQGVASIVVSGTKGQ